MKTSKKLMVIAMAAVLAVVSLTPATFSWYTHNGSNEGTRVNYNDQLPVSVKSGSASVEMKTVVSDEKGEKTNQIPDDYNINPGAVQYYVTTFTNKGVNDVMVDFQLKNMDNDADFVVGSLSPTINEKAYASRASRVKTSYDKTRVYFKTNSQYSAFWAVDNGSLTAESSAAAGSNSTTNDINIAYRESGKTTETMQKMVYAGSDSDTSETGTNKVYYYDVPSDAEYFYFFNHWYLASSSNREWNRTIDITDTTTKGRLFYMTGNEQSGTAVIGGSSKTSDKFKEYKTRAINTNLAGLNSYYSSVRMSTGTNVFADIGLKKTSDADDFVPEYYGSSIEYSSSNPSVASINGDGLITPHTSGTVTITTTIKGVFGDALPPITTTVEIPSKIEQVPILENIRVPHAGSVDENGNEVSNKVDVYWYMRSKKTSGTLQSGGVFFTL